MRLLLAENLWIALIAGALGPWLGAVGRDALLSILPIALPGWVDIDFELPVAGFLLLVSLVSGAACGILPALHASRTSLSEGLKESGRTPAVGPGGDRGGPGAHAAGRGRPDGADISEPDVHGSGLQRG